MNFQILLNTWDITDRLLDRNIFLRYGFDEHLKDFIQDVSALVFYDADGQIENYIRNNSNILLTIKNDDGFYFQGVIEQQIKKGEGYIELKVQNLVFSSYKLGEKIPVGIYTLDQALLKIFPESTDIESVSFTRLKDEYYLKPSTFWSGKIVKNTKGADSNDIISGLIFDDTNYFAIAGTDNIFVYKKSAGLPTELVAHFYLPDHLSSKGWRVRLLGGSSQNEIRFVAYNGSVLRFVTITNLSAFSWTEVSKVNYYDRQTITTTSQKEFMLQAFKTSIWHRANSAFYYATLRLITNGFPQLVVSKVGANAWRASIFNTDLTGLDAGTLAYRYSELKLYYILGHSKDSVFIVYDVNIPPSSIIPGTGFKLVQNTVQRAKSGEDGKVLAIDGSGQLVLFNPFNTNYYEVLLGATEGIDANGAVFTMCSTSNLGLVMSANVKVFGGRKDMQTRAVIYTNQNGYTVIKRYSTGLNNKERSLIEIVFLTDDMSCDGLVIADKYHVPVINASISDRYYPKVIITPQNLNDNVGDLIIEVVQLGFYVLQFLSDYKVKAKSLYNANYNNYQEITDYNITQHNVLLPYKYASIKSYYKETGYNMITSNSTTGFSIEFTTKYSGDVALIKFASVFLDLMSNKPSIIWIETVKKYNVGDILKIKTANNYDNIGMIVSEEWSGTYKYLILSNVATLNTDLYSENPTPSLPIVSLDIQEFETNFYSNPGILIFHVSGVNTGGVITKIDVYVVDYATNGVKEDRFSINMNIYDSFDLRIPYFTYSSNKVKITVSFCNDSGCAVNKAFGIYAGNVVPVLGPVYSSDGQLLAMGLNKSSLYSSILLNSLMQDDDSDGYVESWFEYDYTTHTVGNKIPANNTEHHIGNACGYFSLPTGTPEKYFVSEIIPFTGKTVLYGEMQWTLITYFLKGYTENPEIALLDIGLFYYDKDKSFLGSQLIRFISGSSLPTTPRLFKNQFTPSITNGYYARVYVRLYYIDYTYLQGIWLTRALFQADLRVEEPTLSWNVATKNYVDTRDPYAHEVSDLPVCDASNYGRIAIRQYIDSLNVVHNAVYICKKTGDGIYGWKLIIEDTWSK